MKEQRRISVLIVDDDPVAMEAARSGISLFVDEKRIMTASNSVEMMRILTTVPIDLAFLDMEMPDTDGFTVADYLVKVQPKAKFVFLTGHTELGAKSYEYEPMDFLVKPVSVMRLQKTFERFDRLRSSSPSKGRIAVETSAGFVMIVPEDILYISMDSRKAVIHLRDAEHVVNNALAELELMFADHDIIRCHQSFLVSLAHVSRVEKSGLGRTFQAILDNGEEVPVSREKFPVLKELIARKGTKFI